MPKNHEALQFPLSFLLNVGTSRDFLSKLLCFYLRSRQTSWMTSTIWKTIDWQCTWTNVLHGALPPLPRPSSSVKQVLMSDIKHVYIFTWWIICLLELMYIKSFRNSNENSIKNSNKNAVLYSNITYIFNSGKVFFGVSGEIKFDKNGDVHKPIIINIFKNLD